MSGRRVSERRGGGGEGGAKALPGWQALMNERLDAFLRGRGLKGSMAAMMSAEAKGAREARVQRKRASKVEVAAREIEEGWDV